MSAIVDTPRALTVFAIPEEAHTDLVNVHNFARLMAQLTQVGGNASTVDPRLRPDAMAWCFERLAKELNAIIDVSYYSTELVTAYEAAHKRPAAVAAENA